MQIKGAWPAKNDDVTIPPFIPFASTDKFASKLRG